ncbi:XkdX family protein [Clostridium sp. 19966]|nr:XkdX family protein [Clostridium sp. 19966]MDT8717832.1 XkdX family protein [Clostridium sp. 19966]
MYETLKRLYESGKLSKEKLNNAVVKGWISQDEENQITNAVTN